MIIQQLRSYGARRDKLLTRKLTNDKKWTHKSWHWYSCTTHIIICCWQYHIRNQRTRLPLYIRWNHVSRTIPIYIPNEQHQTIEKQMDSMSKSKAEVRTTECSAHCLFHCKERQAISDHPDLLNCKNKMGLILVLVGTYAFVRISFSFYEFLL